MTVDQIPLTLDVVFGEVFASMIMIMIDAAFDNDNDNLMKDQIPLTLDVVLGEAFASSRRFTICE